MSHRSLFLRNLSRVLLILGLLVGVALIGSAGIQAQEPTTAPDRRG